MGKQPPTLAAYLQDETPELDRVVSAFVSTVRALIAVNEEKGRSEALIPQNIHFDQVGKATIQAPPSSSAQVTTVMSNPRYAAPEMFSEKAAAGDSSTNAANVYALGVMFYEILLGRKVFEHNFPDQKNDIDWMRWHADLESKAPPLKTLLPDCPAALSDLLESMMDKHVEKRPSDLNEILGRLRSVAQRANKTVVLTTSGSPRSGSGAGSRPRIAGEAKNKLAQSDSVSGSGRWSGMGRVQGLAGSGFPEPGGSASDFILLRTGQEILGCCRYYVDWSEPT